MSFWSWHDGPRVHQQGVKDPAWLSPSAGWNIGRPAACRGVRRRDVVGRYRADGIDEQVEEAPRLVRGAGLGRRQEHPEEHRRDVVGLDVVAEGARLRARVEDNLRSLGTDQVPVVNLRRTDSGPGLRASGDQVSAWAA
jgi:hypothetical protein